MFLKVIGDQYLPTNVTHGKLNAALKCEPETRYLLNRVKQDLVSVSNRKHKKKETTMPYRTFHSAENFSI